MFPRRWLTVTACVLLAPWCPADEAEPPDFSQGFKLLTGLGMPELPVGTRWAILPESPNEDEDYRAVPTNMKGNGWLLPPPKGEEKQKMLAMGEVEIAEQQEEEVPAESGGLLRRVLGGKEKPASATADLARDVKSLQTSLGKMKPDDSADPFSERKDFTGAGRLLVFATQIHQTGETRLANEVAAALFKHFQDREAVVDAAVNTLADQQYEAAATEFFKDRDWKAYHQSMVALVAKFPRGWKQHGAAAILTENLSTRIAGNAPAIQPPDKVELDPRAVESLAWMNETPAASKEQKQLPPEVAAQLSQIPARYRAEYLRAMSLDDQSSFGNPGTWLLKTTTAPEQSPGISAPTLRLGIHALPVLAALVDDTWLTPHMNPLANTYVYYSEDQSEAERAATAYAAMNRPASRGDLAIYLLAATLPGSGNGGEELDAQTRRDLALEFWKAHHKDSPEGIALAFVKEGSQEQRMEAAKLLAESKDAAVHQSLEKQVLGEDSPASQLPAVRTYLQIRKSAAKPFLDLYSKALREELGDASSFEDNRDLPWEIRELKSVDPLIKQLEALVSGKSLQARAREIAKEDPATARSSINAFYRDNSETPPRKLLLATLAGAVAAENPEVRGLFVTGLLRIGSGHTREEGEPAESATKPVREMPPGEHKAWSELVADTREVPPTLRFSTAYGKTMGEMAAVAMEQHMDPEQGEKIYLATIVSGKTTGEISLARAKARLASQPLPELPDASKVTPDRLREIVTTAGSKPSMEIHPYLQTLGDDERMAWLQWFAKPGDIEIPANVAKLKTLVISRNTEKETYYLNDMPGVMGIGVGFEFGKESLEKLVHDLAAKAGEHNRSALVMDSVRFGPGLKVLTSKLEMPSPPPEGGEQAEPTPEQRYGAPGRVFANGISAMRYGNPPENATAVITVSCSSGSHGQDIWWIIDGKPVLKEAVPGNPDVATILTNSPPTENSFRLQIEVISREDVMTLTQSQ